MWPIRGARPNFLQQLSEMSAALEDTPTVVTFKAHPFYMQATQVLSL